MRNENNGPSGFDHVSTQFAIVLHKTRKQLEIEEMNRMNPKPSPDPVRSARTAEQIRKAQENIEANRTYWRYDTTTGEFIPLN